MEWPRSVLFQRPQRFDPFSCGSLSLLVYKEVLIILKRKSTGFLFYHKRKIFSPLFLHVCTSIRTDRPLLRKPYKPLCISPARSCSISSLQRSSPDITYWRKQTHQLQLHPPFTLFMHLHIKFFHYPQLITMHICLIFFFFSFIVCISYWASV